MQKMPVVLDVDTGIDDALALLYALASDRLDVRGITTCFGNGDVETTTRNTLAVVSLAERGAPVYQGAAHPLVGQWEPSAEAFHGTDGLGGYAFTPQGIAVQAQSAVQYLGEVTQELSGEIVLIATARLTNIAAALTAHPEMVRRVKRLVIMGGAAFVGGNVTPVAEANIWGDPEAAWIVFHSGMPITMVGLDVTMQVRISDAMLETLDPRRPYAAMLKGAVDFYLGAYNPGRLIGDRTAPLHDPLAVAVAEEPDLCDTIPYAVDIERYGTLTRGMTVVDRREWLPLRPNIDVAVGVDRDRFMTTFARRLGFDDRIIEG
ncbi:MAG: nucleoside hydrolase [Sulfobacillus thermosulfidooxidans]|uniref:Inosine/uridine-preferring nucleoside hydrolase domain-containing protein n=1 Tax=Sulfobacillus thermotolerans TaxID=338644 RepID=A0ABM6RP98_9FIRM|nr:hypothetical protein BXT84_03865 [Sulfobacillus thermotolerans]MCY0908236.1 nucleoside hydrolase [Sulfobacillus thermotolerans]PSR36246.1 MAG: nucleoside hydrolase [Sulfobacillus thermosulfidooxidans]